MAAGVENITCTSTPVAAASTSKNVAVAGSNVVKSTFRFTDCTLACAIGAPQAGVCVYVFACRQLSC